MEFRGQIWLEGERDSSVSAVIEASTDRVVLTSNRAEIASWERSAVDISHAGEGEFVLLAEGERVYFKPEATGFAQVVGLAPSLGDRIRAADQLGPRPSANVDTAAVSSSLSAEAATPRFSKGQKWLIGIGALVVASVIGSLGDTPSNSPVLTVGDDNPPATAAQTVGDSSDWPSESAYILDVQDTSEKMSTLLGTFSEVAIATANGEISMSQFSELTATAITAARSHFDYFDGTTPPGRFAESHRYMIQALGLFVESFETAQRGANRADADEIARATEIMQRGSQALENAVDALPAP